MTQYYTNNWILTAEAKYCVPREPSLRTSYRSSKLRRPRLKLHGCWAYNYCLHIAILDENTQHGSSMTIELIATSLEKCMEISAQRGAGSPTTLVVVGDNTVKELKNQYCMHYVASLISHSKLQYFGWWTLILHVFVYRIHAEILLSTYWRRSPYNLVDLV